ncbi:LexA family transcriptional regulator [Telluribacter sp.]|jgi:transcriptional regulator with XRE-family HTH domain|uniref:XRE family transcriptional regulator n=1 Tax=Telluribacter sp. TaxID=1978767 RepID=UPI002E150FEC|nr:LexA family transcriptional regulator [Telluribacter sp.]
MYFAQNLIFLRSQHQERPSQQKLADTLGFKKSTLAAWESGRAKPSFEDLLRLAEYFQVSTDDLLKQNLAERRAKPWLKEDNLRVLVTTVGHDERENIEYVPVKAIGGYPEGYGDVEYVAKLPVISLPFLSNDRKYRAFPYEGDSMPPMREGAVVFGEYIEYWEKIKSGTICLVVTKDEGVVLKKIFNYLEEKGVLVLKSLNERYAPYPVRREDILEMWLFAGFFDREFPVS